MERRTNENEETREFDHTDFYQMYQDEMDCIVPCTAQEMEDLSEELLKWKRDGEKAPGGGMPFSGCRDCRGVPE